MSERSSFNISSIIGSAALIVGTLAVNAFLTDHLMKQRLATDTPMVVTVNAADMLMGFVASRDPNISPAEIEAQAKAFNANLDGYLSDFAEQNNLLIVNSAAIVSGAPDVTAAVLQSIGLAGSETGS